jgi:hypothetical protein
MKRGETKKSEQRTKRKRRVCTVILFSSRYFLSAKRTCHIHANNEHIFECFCLLLAPAALNDRETMLKFLIFTFSSSVFAHKVTISQQYKFALRSNYYQNEKKQTCQMCSNFKCLVYRNKCLFGNTAQYL